VGTIPVLTDGGWQAETPAGAVPQPPPGDWRRWGLVAVITAAVVAGLVLRFVSAGPLWLDEAQSVAIAKRPIVHLFGTLRHDGSPPLYYVLLHFWMAIFGGGTFAVRALSGVLSATTLPLLYLLGRRLVGGTYAVVAVLLLASSPFAIHYASETRMYSLVMLLVVIAGLALVATLRGPTVLSTVGLALVTGALLLSHYWAFFLVGATVLGLLRGALAGYPGPRAAIVGLLGGLLPVVPWFPDLIFQVRHTGTPWSDPRWRSMLGALSGWFGGTNLRGMLLCWLLAAMVLFALTARRRAGWVGRKACALTMGTLFLATCVSLTIGGAIVSRYTAVALVPFLLTVAAGVLVLRRRVPALAIVATLAAATIGLTTAAQAATAPRSAAKQIAAAVDRADPERDVVIYCPDQISPDVYRLTGPELRQRERVYPSGGSPEYVDWVDYRQRIEAADPDTFVAQQAADLGAGGAIWLVVELSDPAYPGSCSPLVSALAGAYGFPQSELVAPGLSGGRIDVFRYTPPGTTRPPVVPPTP
jgi:mannosyltransferase